jgi:peptide/nickel transport system substrate-binding protein
MNRNLRKLLVAMLILSTTALSITSCATPTPEVVEVEKVVTQVVKEEVLVEGTPETVEVEVTKIVQVEVTPTPEPVEETGPEGTLRFLMGEPFVSFDPHDNFVLAMWSVHRNIFDRLVSVDAQGTPMPHLAESWSLIDDNTWEFKLRDDVTFHDGTPFDANAAAYTINRVGNFDNALTLSSLWIPCQAEVIDDYTVHVTSDVPFGKLLYALSVTDVVKDGDADREDFAERPIGTGPFTFVEREGDRITVQANMDYWMGPPRLAEIIFEYIPDANVRLTALQTGEAQLIDNLQVDQIPVIAIDPNLQVIEGDTWQTTYINFRNTTSDFFTQNTEEQNLLIRQALFHAIDRDTIQQTILSGLGAVSTGPTTSNLMDFSDFMVYDYNPEKAKELLAEAGYPDGFSGVSLYTSEGQWPKSKEIAEAIVNNWAEIGVDVDLQVLEVGALVGHIIDNTGDMVHFGAVITNGDPAGIDGHIYSGEGTTGWAFTGYTSDEANELVLAARTAVDHDEFIEAAKAVDRYVWDNALYISLFESFQLLGASADLQGFTPDPGLVRNLYTASLGD